MVHIILGKHLKSITMFGEDWRTGRRALKLPCANVYVVFDRTQNTLPTGKSFIEFFDVFLSGIRVSSTFSVEFHQHFKEISGYLTSFTRMLCEERCFHYTNSCINFVNMLYSLFNFIPTHLCKAIQITD